MNVWSTAAGIPPGGRAPRASRSGRCRGRSAARRGRRPRGAPLPRGAPPAQPLPAGGRRAGAAPAAAARAARLPEGAQPPPPPPPGAAAAAAGRGASPLPQGAMQPVNVMTTTKLHEEVVSYANRNLAACESSHTEVNQIMIRMRNIVDKLWSGAPEMHGSRSTGLYLATSDVDVVLTGLPMPTSPSDAKRSVPEKLTRLHAELEKEETGEVDASRALRALPALRRAPAPPARPARPRRHARRRRRLAPSRPSSALPSSALFSLTLPLPLRRTARVDERDPDRRHDRRDAAAHRPPRPRPRDGVFGGGAAARAARRRAEVVPARLQPERLVHGRAVVVLPGRLPLQLRPRDAPVRLPHARRGYLLVGFLTMFLYRFEQNNQGMATMQHVDDLLVPTTYNDQGMVALGDNIMHSCYQVLTWTHRPGHRPPPRPLRFPPLEPRASPLSRPRRSVACARRSATSSLSSAFPTATY